MNETDLRLRISHSRFINLGTDEPPLHTWDRNRYELARQILSPDSDPARFLQWATIHQTMFPGENRTTSKEARELFEYSSEPQRWFRSTIEPSSSFGGGTRMSKYPYHTGAYIHQAYHLSAYEQLTGIRVDEISNIVEFGGGYGAMRVLCARLGAIGKYYLYDNLEFALLQEYYLSNVGFPAIYRIVDDDGRFPIVRETPDLLIACYSFSEVDPMLREAFFSTMRPKSVLIVHQDSFYDHNLIAEFDAFMARHDGYEWNTRPATTEGHRYITGVKK